MKVALASKLVFKCTRSAPVICRYALLTLALVYPVAFAQSQVEFTQQEVDAIVAQGPWPVSVPADPGNELSDVPWAEKLGESLFFDASLSTNQSVSCGTCHLPGSGFDDNKPVGIGLEHGVRNTQGLLDVGLQRWFGWDGGADSLWAASIRPMFNATEMGNDTASLAKALKANAQFMFTIKANRQKLSVNDQSQNSTDADTTGDNGDNGDTGVLVQFGNEELIAIAGKSIAAYLRTLRSPLTEFDRFRDALANQDTQVQSNYSESAQRGLKIFVGEANCRVCHFGGNFSNGEFHDTGRPFFTGVGQVDPGRYTGIQRVKQDPYNLLGKYAASSSLTDKHKTSEVKLSQSNWGQWRTPSLRNLAHTAPYMHDGSLQTLRDVVDAYADIDIDRLHSQGESILKPLDLTNEQRDDLVNFLLSLSK